MKQQSDGNLTRREVLARHLALLPGTLFLGACVGPATRAQARQTARVQGRTQQRQADRRGW